MTTNHGLEFSNSSSIIPRYFWTASPLLLFFIHLFVNELILEEWILVCEWIAWTDSLLFIQRGKVKDSDVTLSTIFCTE